MISLRMGSQVALAAARTTLVGSTSASRTVVSASLRSCRKSLMPPQLLDPCLALVDETLDVGADVTALRSWELTETGSKPHHAPRMRAQSVKVTSRVQTWASKSRYSHARTFQSKILQHLLSLRSAFMCLCRLCPAPHPGPTSSFACVHDREAGADCVLAISELVCFGPHV